MSDPFKPLRDIIAAQAKSRDPAKRAGSKLLKGSLDSVIEFKRLVDADPTSDAAAEIAVGLVDAMAMVMSSLLTHLDELPAIALANRLADSIGHVIRARSEVKDVH